MTKTYEDGVRDGEIAALKILVDGHAQRIDRHAHRLHLLERIVWVAGGIAITVQAISAYPQVMQLLIQE